jgi:hypothetical protein
MYLLLGWKDRAADMVAKLAQMDVTDTFDHMQLQLYRACSLTELTQSSQPVLTDVKRIHVLIPCDNSDRFDEMCMQIRASCLCPAGWHISYESCHEAQRVTAYESALQFQDFDILVIVQKNITIHNPLFFLELSKSLDECDMVGFAGAQRWERMDWRSDNFEKKAAGFLVASSEIPGYVEIQYFGSKEGTIVREMTVLDGGLLALKCSAINLRCFDDELVGAETILEEDWTHTCFLNGLRLNVHRNLGVMVDQHAALDSKYRDAGRMQLAEKRGFDPFAILKDDQMMVSAPVSNISEAIRVMNIFLEATS